MGAAGVEWLRFTKPYLSVGRAVIYMQVLFWKALEKCVLII